MYKNNPTQRQAGHPTPANVTPEVLMDIEANLVKFYKSSLTPARVISERKACYSLVINSTNAQYMPLEQAVGSDTAKFMTSRILLTLLAGHPDVGTCF